MHCICVDMNLLPLDLTIHTCALNNTHFILSAARKHSRLFVFTTEVHCHRAERTSSSVKTTAKT